MNDSYASFQVTINCQHCIDTRSHLEGLMKEKAEIQEELLLRKDAVIKTILEWIVRDVKTVIDDTVIKQYEFSERLGAERLAMFKTKAKEIREKVRSLMEALVKQTLPGPNHIQSRVLLL